MLPDESAFAEHVSQNLAQLNGVTAISLGGSRVTGTHVDDSDWDFAIYYRHQFDPTELRAVGWPGEVSGIGEWGGGVFNGGARLIIDGRKVDIPLPRPRRRRITGSRKPRGAGSTSNGSRSISPESPPISS